MSDRPKRDWGKTDLVRHYNENYAGLGREQVRKKDKGFYAALWARGLLDVVIPKKREQLDWDKVDPVKFYHKHFSGYTSGQLQQAGNEGKRCYGALVRRGLLESTVPRKRKKWTPEQFEREISSHYVKHKSINSASLTSHKRQDLLGQMPHYQRKGLRGHAAVCDLLGISPSRKPRSRERFESEVREHYEKYGEVSHKSLRRAGLMSISSQASNYTFGGMNGMGAVCLFLGVAAQRTTWPRERFEKEIRAYYAEHRTVNRDHMAKHQRKDLAAQIAEYAQDGLEGHRAVCALLGIAPSRKLWNRELIEKEIREYHAEHGVLKQSGLVANGRGDLAHKIATYERDGLKGWPAAYALVGIRPSVIKMSREEFEQAIRSYYETHGNVKTRDMQRNGNQHLITWIEKYEYQGREKMGGVYAFLGIRPLQTVWSRELFEKEIKDFYAAHGVVTQKALFEHRKSGLRNQIAGYTFGGLRGAAAVHKLLGIGDHGPDLEGMLNDIVGDEE